MAAISLAAGAEIDVVTGDELKQAMTDLRRGLESQRERMRPLSGAVTAAAATATITLGRCSVAYSWDLRTLMVTGAGSAPAYGSYNYSGQITAPGAVATVAAGVPPAGLYTVTVTVGYGSPAGTVQGNFQLYSQNQVVAGHLQVPLIAGAMETYTFQNVPANGLQSIAVYTVSADASGVYIAQLQITPAGGSGGSVGIHVAGDPSDIGPFTQYWAEPMAGGAVIQRFKDQIHVPGGQSLVLAITGATSGVGYTANAWVGEREHRQ